MNLGQQLQNTLGSAYTLDRELGGGGMSRVFVAEERRLNRKVVIKVLSPELAAGVSAERFEREIQLAASLQQANIVPILAAGDTEGLPFYTMPYVEGQSIRSRLSATGALPVADVIGILRDVAKALSYAHDRGVVHRDIKPDNVLLSGGTAVVTDFGIAKAISAARAPSDSGTLTQLGTSIGTPAYMAPEQAAGDPSVDHRADIYSLGIMAFEMLTGQTPFHGRTPARMLAAHMTETVPTVSQLRPDVPSALDTLVARCLAKEPAERPQTGAEIAQLLDAATTGGSAIPALRLDAPGGLRKMLLAYVLAAAGVAIVARASLVVFGLPDWVFTGAMIVILLGLPAILLTWYVQHTARRVATTTPAHTPGGTAAHGTLATLAVRASPHVSWRRAWTLGATALGAFVAVVAGFLILRSMGIGPAGSLLAAGKLSDRERLIVTEFQSADTSLSTLVTEAVRTTLGQSRVISIMPPVAISAALQRMQRPTASRLDFALAREIAQREGVRAIVDGSIRPLGGGFVVSMRLVGVDSANDLAVFQKTADTPGELLGTIDGLTRELRGKIGESLRDVRGSTPLEQVTTPSLEALRIYAEAARFVDKGGNPLEGAERLREAVRLDTGFAMAWRKLGVALSNAGMPRARVDSALERAYRFRDRLTERERLMAEGTYYQLGPGRDRRRAIQAYERLLAIDPTESGAANNLASILSGRRDFARAESLFKAQIAGGASTSQQYTNLIGVLFNGGKIDEAARYLKTYQERFPTASFAMTGPVSFLYHRNELDSLERHLRAMAASQNQLLKVNAAGNLGNLAILRGRVADAVRYAEEAQRIARALSGSSAASPMLYDSLRFSWMDLQWMNDTARAVRRIENVLAKEPPRTHPEGMRPYGTLATFFAEAGRLARAREFFALDEAEPRDSTQSRLSEPGRNAIRGVVARAEGRYDEALRLLWKADTTYDGPDGNCAMCLYDDIGITWDRAGNADSAITYLERYMTTPYLGRLGMDASQRAILHRRLGELHESKGDAANAARHYREFLRLWERADPMLQPKVAEVRRRLSRLSSVEGR
ncbi:MAG TPA: serine/threonine-protein kinase [Gemmatimonadaceae bacterium]|nr:serine/threonine-protein kinase [Gemmatimonadaceae bacterium]